MIATANGNANLYNGFHTLFDKTSSQCVSVDPELARGSDYTVGNVESSFELRSVTSRDELASELGLDLGLKVKYLGTSADAQIDMTRKLKRNSRTANLILKIKSSYTVRNRQQLMLTANGLSRLAEGPARFVSACGTHYINGVQYAADVYLLITYTAHDEQTALDMKASLGLAGGLGPVDLSADVKSRLSRSSDIAGVSTTIEVATRGFSIDPSNEKILADLLNGNLTDETFSRLDNVRSSLASSIANDACRDTGEGVCQGVTAPGYFDNASRTAVPAAVDIGFYDGLINVPLEGASHFGLIKERLTIVERFIRDWAELEERMEDVYWSEISIFLAADADAKSSYQIAPPGEPVRAPIDLIDISDEYMEMFFPEQGSQIGWKYEIAANMVRDCWNGASVDLLHACAPQDMAGTDMEEWRDIETDLNTYDKEARILPLHYRLSASDSYDDSRDACTALNTAGITYRPPTLQEAKLLAPALGFGTIAWTGDSPHQTWIAADDPSALCPDPARPNPTYRNAPSSSAGSVVCVDKDGIFSGVQLNTVCVPSGGPLPLLALP